MVLTSRSVLVLVVLHLHASDTRREEIEDSWIQEPVETTYSALQTSSADKTPSPLNRQRKVISREDEDLLDLMVRIAESPAEWERIHRVLNQLGTDYETSSNTHTGNKRTGKLSREYHNISKLSNEINHTNSIAENLTTVSSVHSIVKNEKSINPLTQATDTTITANYLRDEKPLKSRNEKVDTDTGWPDFREAILKTVNKHNKKSEKSKILETSWIDNTLLDSSWDEYDKKNQPELNTYLESNVINPVVGFKQVKTRKESNSLKDPHIIRSRLYQDPKILEFPLKGLTSDNNNTSYQNASADVGELTNKTSRPMFLYHRVTTSPQERKNSAFIAVSVVKQGSLAPPATDSSPVDQLENMNEHWSSNPYLNRAKGITKSLDDHSRRKRPHLIRQGNHHNRGRRHHHPDTHSHL